MKAVGQKIYRAFVLIIDMTQYDIIKTYCKECASPISHSEYGVKNQMCDMCIGELIHDMGYYFDPKEEND